MAAFVCQNCYADPTTHGDGLVRYRQDRFTIEVAAKSADGKERAAQVTLPYTFCRKHATEYVNDVRRDMSGLKSVGGQVSF